MKCSKCGKESPVGNLFCQYCGMKLTPSSVATAEITEDLSAGKGNRGHTAPAVMMQESLLDQAYRSFCSQNPQERAFFENLRGSELLRSAYLDERDKGLCSPLDDTEGKYAAFVRVLYDDFFGGAPQPVKTDARDFKQTVQTSACGAKKPASTGATVAIVILSVLLALAVAVGAILYHTGRTLKENLIDHSQTVAEKEEEIEALEGSNYEQQDAMQMLQNANLEQSQQIKAQEETIAALEKKSDEYNRLCQLLASGNVGYSSDNFRVSEGVIVVRKNEMNRQFVLTAYWDPDRRVVIEGDEDIASLDFEVYSWAKDVTMTIRPHKEGVAVFTYSNNGDSKTFKQIIIVTE